MTRLTYAEQLRHPKWQRRRLEMLQAANFTCAECSGTESTLHVHHKRYFKGRMAWEYTDTELQVLCEECHQAAHDLQEGIGRALNLIPAAEALSLLCGFLDGGGDGESTDQATEHSDPHAYLAGHLARAARNLTTDQIIGLEQQATAMARRSSARRFNPEVED